jgi:hypothetical protein
VTEALFQGMNSFVDGFESLLMKRIYGIDSRSGRIVHEGRKSDCVVVVEVGRVE